jgi:hypothetical protein
MAGDKRGSGTKAFVLPNTKVPRNWHEFLRVDDNTTTLFHFLADTKIPSFLHSVGKTVVFTYNEEVKVSLGND